MQTYIRIRYLPQKHFETFAGHCVYCVLRHQPFKFFQKNASNKNEKLRGETLHEVREESILIFFKGTSKQSQSTQVIRQ